MFRGLIRRLLPADPYAPSIMRSLVSSRYRSHKRIQKQIVAVTGGRVAAGPFTGLRYTHRAVGSMLGPKLLGTYELELAPVINQIAAISYPVVIDIGAAEGYYAVGLAMRLPSARIIAFEAQVDQHRTLLHMADLNGVRERIEMRGMGTVQTLGGVLPADPHNARTLIICDIEGYETELLDPVALPKLQHADVLVELHDCYRPRISELLRSRFASSHRITHILTRPRTLADWPAGVPLRDDLKLRAMHEGRPGEMAWFWMQSNAGR
jgi:hypothetical protein